MLKMALLNHETRQFFRAIRDGYHAHPDIEIPDLSDRVCMVTGSNTGIGKETVRELARAGAHVLLACRSRERAEGAAKEVKEETGNTDVEFIELDLASLGSVRSCAEKFLARDLPLHIIVNNAGVAGVNGTTENGFELTFGVNHLGHFLLTQRLMERLEDSAPSRVVTVSSQGHRLVDKIDWEALEQRTQSRSGLREYNISKLANILFTAEAARQFEDSGVQFYAANPGVVASDIWRNIPWPFESVMTTFMRTNEDGAKTSLYCATSPDVADESGDYYSEARHKSPSDLAQNEVLARDLWERSLEWTGLSY
jgi:NAD(P)-dependent dehydrogenase (short-subunit alcohol dehydrogenase family)